MFSVFRASLASRSSPVQLIIAAPGHVADTDCPESPAVGAGYTLAVASSNLGGTRGNAVYQNLLSE